MYFFLAVSSCIGTWLVALLSQKKSCWRIVLRQNGLLARDCRMNVYLCRLLLERVVNEWDKMCWRRARVTVRKRPLLCEIKQWRCKGSRESAMRWDTTITPIRDRGSHYKKKEPVAQAYANAHRRKKERKRTKKQAKKVPEGQGPELNRRHTI